MQSRAVFLPQQPLAIWKRHERKMTTPKYFMSENGFSIILINNQSVNHNNYRYAENSGVNKFVVFGQPIRKENIEVILSGI